MRYFCNLLNQSLLNVFSLYSFLAMNSFFSILIVLGDQSVEGLRKHLLKPQLEFLHRGGF